jgi:hypothetical protein
MNTYVLYIYDNILVILRMRNISDNKRYSIPVTGLEWPRGLQEVKVPRFHDNGTG